MIVLDRANIDIGTCRIRAQLYTCKHNAIVYRDLFKVTRGARKGVYLYDVHPQVRTRGACRRTFFKIIQLALRRVPCTITPHDVLDQRVALIFFNFRRERVE